MHKRMRVTSQKVLSEIPHCPLSENRIIVTAGDPVNEITKIAEQGHFDLIIMGTHGHGEFGKIMLGSTASGVISKSRVPVLVARSVLAAWPENHILLTNPVVSFYCENQRLMIR